MTSTCANTLYITQWKWLYSDLYSCKLLYLKLLIPTYILSVCAMASGAHCDRVHQFHKQIINKQLFFQQIFFIHFLFVFFYNWLTLSNDRIHINASRNHTKLFFFILFNKLLPLSALSRVIYKPAYYLYNLWIAYQTCLRDYFFPTQLILYYIPY